MIIIISEGRYKGLASIILENQEIRAEFIPEYGGKMVSLSNKRSKREFLFQSDLEELRVPEYGADFSKYDSSGFDEVFPSIDESFYPEGSWQGTLIPDHGEVWTLPWEVELEDDLIKFSVISPRFPYRLEKQVILKEEGIRIEYQATNLSQEEFKFIWTAHALLNCDHQNTKIILPEEVKQIINVEKSSEHLGSWGQIYDYPLATTQSGQELDLSRIEPITANNCEKFYSLDRLKEGRCALEYTDTQERLSYEFPVDKVPYLAVWKTQGGYRGDYNLALEPCTGVYDDLYLADKLDRAAIIPAEGSYQWYLEMKIENY